MYEQMYVMSLYHVCLGIYIFVVGGLLSVMLQRQDGHITINIDGKL